jgi:HK97 family phage portal protein
MPVAAIKEKVGRWFGSTVEHKSGLATPEAWLSELFGASPTLSGPAVTPQSAMRVPAVAAAVSLISSTVGTLPAKVFARGADGKAPDTSHAAHALVHDDANDWTSATALRTALTADALLHDCGGAAFVNRVEGRPVELIRLAPGSFTRKEHATTGEPFFEIGQGRDKRTLPFRDVLHIQAPAGVAPVTLAKEAIGLALTLEQHAARLFGNGARPSGLITFKTNPGPEGLAKAKTAWQAAHGGDKSGGTAVMPGDATWQGLTLTSVDAQFAEMRAFQIVEIARAFRVPPHMLFEMGRATWGNSEQMMSEFLRFCLLSWLRIWEAAYRRTLISADERDTRSIEFIVDDLLRADTATRAAAYAQFRSAGVLTANECRALENRPALAGGDTLANPNITPGAAA